jgi:hypothetical protein
VIVSVLLMLLNKHVIELAIIVNHLVMVLYVIRQRESERVCVCAQPPYLLVTISYHSSTTMVRWPLVMMSSR